MKTRLRKTLKWVGFVFSILIVLFLVFVIVVNHISSSYKSITNEYKTGNITQVMVGYSKPGKTTVHYPTFFKNDSILLKNLVGTDPSSVDSVYISPFIEISNNAPPMISWAFPSWELVVDRFVISKGQKLNSMIMIPLVKRQGYFYLQFFLDKEAYKRKVRIATPDQLPSCVINY